MKNVVTFARYVLAMLVGYLFLASPSSVLGSPFVFQDVIVEEMVVDGEGGDEVDDEDGDGIVIQDNPWGVDERKMKAAKLFWFQKAFRIEVQKIKMVCELDKKQALKLKIASKGAAKKEMEVWLKKWTQQMKQFQEMNFGNAGPVQKKKKQNQEELVINDADEIDEQAMQFMDNSSMMFGEFEEERKAVDSQFWIKTVRGVLTPEQNDKYLAFLKQRNDAHIAAKIDAFVARMQLELALTDDQAAKYDALVRPAMEKAPILSGYYETFAFQYYATQYDEEKMKSLLNEDQFQMMKMVLGPSKGYGAMLDQDGFEDAGVVGFEVNVGGTVLEAVGDAVGDFAEGVGDFMGKLMETAGDQK
jgi:hypothetical protein